jgi:hypothetical protein
MGYSARYHAASLAAVFLALAIGILIGVGFGDDVVSGTQKSLEKSLKGDLEDARGEVEELGAQLDREREFGQRAYPALVGGRLGGERVALIGLGGLPGDVSGDVEEALGPTGARLAEVAVVREPPNLDGLASDLERTRFARIEGDPGLLEDYAERAGRGLVRGGRLLRRTRASLLSRVSGEAAVNEVILVRDPPDEVDPEERDPLKRIENGLVAGIRQSGAPVVAVERSDAERSQVSFFDTRGITTVDDLDRTSGRVAMVFALLGAEGNFGTKSTADRLLPELLVPSGRRAGPR